MKTTWNSNSDAHKACIVGTRPVPLFESRLWLLFAARVSFVV